ncbi:MAG: SOS response-associated peptidase [SAR324 cluster bacterium]|uniref:Abasic site processing protein n=1 Tax=SAR324 cluster bacterium TaxID=2024889 RepID=A0A7X9IKJ5_9DELT|nr:SOS response-associated peptidase [SAR324 cluster bacterium]
MQKIAKHFSAVISEDAQSFKIPGRIVPKREGPLLLNEETGLSVSLGRFSLLPSWSKEKNLKYSTHNARLDTVHEKATWRDPFINQHCVVPLDAFIEAVYSGPYAGNMLAFESLDNEPLYAAAIFDKWSVLGEAPILSFAIITDEADSFVSNLGHDREPIFLSKRASLEWLFKKEKNALTVQSFLRENRAEPRLKVEIERPLKAGWEKRRQ